jgi:hypothetical protein
MARARRSAPAAASASCSNIPLTRQVPPAPVIVYFAEIIIPGQSGTPSPSTRTCHGTTRGFGTESATRRPAGVACRADWELLALREFPTCSSVNTVREIMPVTARIETYPIDGEVRAGAGEHQDSGRNAFTSRRRRTSKDDHTGGVVPDGPAPDRTPPRGAGCAFREAGQPLELPNGPASPFHRVDPAAARDSRGHGRLA